MTRIHTFSNRHIINQVKNIRKNDWIVLENSLSQKRWELMFEYYNINSKKLSINFMTKEEYLNLDTNKFNNLIIVGNPPYNDAVGDNRANSQNSNNSNLYFDFIEKSIELKPKVITLIVPAGWMTNDKIKQKVIDAGLKRIKQIDPSHFPTVGIRSGITQMHIEFGYNGKIEIESLISTFEINRDAVLSFDNPKKFTLIEKLRKSKMFDSLLTYGPYKVPKGSKGNIERLVELDSDYSQSKTEIHKTKVMIYTGGTLTKPRYLWHTQNFTNNRFGIVIPSASDKHIIGAVRIIFPGEGVSDKLKVVYFDTLKEAENCKKFLESKLVSFIIRTTKHNDTVNTNKNSFGNIPVINFKKTMKETNVLELFNLTEEDLDVIN